MKLHLKKDRCLTYFFVFLGVLIVSLFSCLIILQHLSKLQIKSADRRYESYLLADELRQSSDDLTKMVRLYVITGNPEYREHFNDILAIRDGKKARPENYHQIRISFFDILLCNHLANLVPEDLDLKYIVNTDI